MKERRNNRNCIEVEDFSYEGGDEKYSKEGKKRKSERLVSNKIPSKMA